MLKKLLMTFVLAAVVFVLVGCQTVEGFGQAVQGLGKDISWLSKQRVHFYSVEEGHKREKLYYSRIGQQKAYFRKVDDEYVLVSLK